MKVFLLLLTLAQLVTVLFEAAVFTTVARADEQYSVSDFNIGEDAVLAKSGEVVSWKHAYIGIQKRGDWAPFDYLVIKLKNSGKKVLSLHLEIRDTQSHDYWTRANLNFSLAPGEREFRFSTRPKAGEDLRPGRALNFKEIVSLILARDSSAEGEPVEIESIKLVTEKKLDVRGIYAFNFGPEQTTAFPGMKVIHPDTLFSDENGVGWVEPKIWSPYREACALRGPDRLYQNCIMIYGGKLKLRLPNGHYHLFMNIDHPGGFWGEFPLFKHRIVRAQGRAVVDETMTPAEGKRRFFEFEKQNDSEGMDVFDTYVSHLFKEKRFEADVKDGTLELQFENQECGQISCFGLALSTLVIFSDEKKEQGKLFLEEVRQKRKEDFQQRYYEVTSDSGEKNILPKNSEDLTWFSPPVEKPIFQKANYSREVQDPRRKITGFANQKEEAVLSLALRNETGAARTIEVVPGTLTNETGNLLPESAWKPGWAVWKITRLTPDGSQFQVSERYWKEGSALNARPGLWERAMIRLKIPVKQPPGLYKGSLLVKSKGVLIANVPVEVRVFSTPLQPIDLSIGPFGSSVQENWWFGLETTPRARSLRNESLKRMRNDGLNAFSFSPHIRFTEKKSDFDLDTSLISETMKEAKSLGFREVVGYSEVFQGLDLCNADHSPAQLKKIFKVMEERSRKESWLPLTLVVCDEPEGDFLDTLLKRMDQWPALSETARVRWSVTTNLSSKASLQQKRLVERQSFPFLADFGANFRPQKPWAFYNNSSRFNFGFRLFALKQRSALALRLAWTWNQNSGNPYYALDGREDDYNWCNSTSSGDLICTLQYDRQVLRGVQDYRYALTLQKLIDRSPELLKRPDGQEAEKLLSELNDLDPAIEDWDPKLNDLRYRIAELIDLLSAEPGAK